MNARSAPGFDRPSPAEALVVLVVALTELDIIASSVSTERTPGEAEAIQRAMIAAVAKLRERIPLDVGRMADIYASPERNALKLTAAD